MKLLNKGIVVLMSLLLISCSAITSPFSGGNNKNPESANEKHMEGLSELKAVKTKDLYGAWANTEEGDVDLFYIVLLLPNHVGLNYMTLEKQNGKQKSVYTEYYTWEFNEKTKVFTSHAFERKISEHGKPEKVESVKETEHHETTMYKAGDKNLVIQFVRPGEKYIFVKLDDAIYQKMVEDIPLPSLKK